MIDILTIDHLRDLAEYTGRHCISMYMPTQSAGRETRQNPIQLKNRLEEAEQRLKDREMKQREIDDSLSSPRSFLESDSFFKHQADGLVLFISDNFFEYYRLPLDFEELTYVNERFYIKPLLPLFSDNERFYVLALDLGGPVLYQATKFAMNAANVEDMPKNIEEVLQFDQEERQLQTHTRRPQRTGEMTAVFHGQEREKRYSHQRMKTYAVQINKAVRGFLTNENAPLILIGLDDIVSVYTEANTYPHLYDKVVRKDPQHLDQEAIHKAAYGTIEDYFTEGKDALINRFMEEKKNNRTDTSIQKILPASVNSRVDCLFLAKGAHSWGNFRNKSAEVEMHEKRNPGDDELLDLAAVHTLSNGGTVLPLAPEKVPEEGMCASIYRY